LLSADAKTPDFMIAERVQKVGLNIVIVWTFFGE